MTVAGQPTSFRPGFCELEHDYCLLGATSQELAGFLHVAPRIIDNWIAERPVQAVRASAVSLKGCTSQA